MTGRVQFTVDIQPGDGRINGRFEINAINRAGHSTLRKSVRYRSYVEHVAHACRGRCERFDSGLCSVSMVFYWPTQDHETLGRNAKYPRGDVDASIKATLDGLQLAGVIDDDARVVEVRARKAYDRARPRVEITIHAAPHTVPNSG